MWRKLSGGCSITRDPIVAITTAGFTIEDVAAKPFPFAQMLLGTHYSGEACVRTRAAKAEVRVGRQAQQDRALLPA